MKKQALAIALVMACCLCAVLPAQALNIERLADQILMGDGSQTASAAGFTIMQTSAEGAAQAPASPVSTEAPESAFRFSVVPVLPENQSPEVTAFFSLTVQPGAEQTLTVDIQNEGREDITVSMEATGAITNENGAIQYVNREGGPSGETPFHMPDILQFEEGTVVIPSMQSRRVSVALDVPEADFTGTLMGGLVFIRQPDEAEGQTGGMMVNSLFSYVIPVLLRSTEKAEAQPGFDQVAAAPNTDTIFGPRTILTVRNPHPMLLKPVKMEYTLFAADDPGTPIASHTAETIEMAPYATMRYAIQQPEALAPGAYTAHVALTYQGAEHPFELDVTLE